jgi:hypothetical protein
MAGPRIASGDDPAIQAGGGGDGMPGSSPGMTIVAL